MLWGTVFVAANVGLQYTNAYILVFIRFLLATAAIAVLVILFNRRLGVTRELGRASIWLLGAVDAVGFLLQYVGQSLTNTSDATLLANLAPVLVPLVAWRLCKESVSKFQGIAMVLGLSGLALLASPSTKFQGTSAPGDLLLFGASVSFSFFVVLSKRLNAVTTGSALAVIMAITLFLAPAALLLGRLNPLSFTIGLDGWYSSLYMGIICTVIPMVLYLRGLTSISSSESGTLLLLEMLSGLILAVSLLREVPTGHELLASAAIIATLAMGVGVQAKQAQGTTSVQIA
jgi:drug/metabolite transporter (DMT)-like permease